MNRAEPASLPQDTHRNICLIPRASHGTNPATAAMCGMDVVPIECDDQGNTYAPNPSHIVLRVQRFGRVIRQTTPGTTHRPQPSAFDPPPNK